MLSVQSGTCTVRIAARSLDLPGFDTSAGFAVAEVSGGGRELVLVPGIAAAGATLDVPTDQVITVSRPLTPALALLVPPLATAMSFWDRLGLELGDAAVYTAGGPLSRLTGQVALWRGGCPVVELSATDSTPAGDITRIDWTDVEEATRQLTAATEHRPGFAAVELSGRADVLDTLLETMPRWSRLLLASTNGGPVTIDYYKNVHRKGAIVDATVGDPAVVFDRHLGAAIQAQLARAAQWLERPALAAKCAAALGLAPASR